MHEIADVWREEAAIDRNQITRIYVTPQFSLDRLGELNHQPVRWIPITVD